MITAFAIIGAILAWFVGAVAVVYLGLLACEWLQRNSKQEPESASQPKDYPTSPGSEHVFLAKR